jgi:hypothetical protein
MPMNITYCKGGSRNFSVGGRTAKKKKKKKKIVGIKLIFEDLLIKNIYFWEIFFFFNFGGPKHRLVLPPCICFCFILY